MTIKPGIPELLSALVERTPGFMWLVALSEDGTALSWSELSPEKAEVFAAMAAVWGGIGKRLATEDKADVRCQLIDMKDDGYLLLTRAGRSSYLALRADPTAGPEVATYEISVLANRIGDALDTARHSDLERQRQLADRAAAARRRQLLPKPHGRASPGSAPTLSRQRS